MLRTTTQKGFIFDEFFSFSSRKFPDQTRFRTGTSYSRMTERGRRKWVSVRAAFVLPPCVDGLPAIAELSCSSL